MLALFLIKENLNSDFLPVYISIGGVSAPIGPLPICMIASTHLSGLPGTCRRRRHLLAHWICSSLMRMSLCRARHQSWATVVFKFFDGEIKTEEETDV